MAILSYSKVKHFWVLILTNFMVLLWQFCPVQNWQSLGQGEIPKGCVHKEYSYIGRIVRKRRGGDGGVCPLPWIRKIKVFSKAFHQSIFVFEITSLAAQGYLHNAVQGQFTKMLSLVHIQARHHWVSIWLEGGGRKNLLKKLLKCPVMNLTRNLWPRPPWGVGQGVK